MSYGGYGGELQHYQPQVHPPAGYSAPTTPDPWTQPSPPAAPVAPYGRVAQPPQRPALVTMAATLAVTGSLQFLTGLTLLWLIAVAGNQELGTTGADGVMFHILNRFNDRMLTGLAFPLYLFPLGALALGLLLPTRRPWTRLAFSLLGLAAVAWLAWLFRYDLEWLILPGAYIAFCVGLVWTSAASRWYSWPSASDGYPQPR